MFGIGSVKLYFVVKQRHPLLKIYTWSPGITMESTPGVKQNSFRCRMSRRVITITSDETSEKIYFEVPKVKRLKLPIPSILKG